MEKISHANGNKKAVVAILVSDKIDFKTKVIARYKEGHYIILKGVVQKVDRTLVNTCTQQRDNYICEENIG